MEHGNLHLPLATSKRKTPKLTDKPSERKWKALEDYSCHHGKRRKLRLKSFKHGVFTAVQNERNCVQTVLIASICKGDE